MNKLVISNRLARAGIKTLAEAYREEVRQRLAKEKGGPNRDREAVNRESWEEMWKLYEPACKSLESQMPSQLVGMPDNLKEAIDPEYNENDRGRQLRDGWLWAAMEWACVIRDTDAGPIVTLELANKPPPNSFALSVLSIYALSDLDKRRELIAKALQFAEKSHNTPPADAKEEEDGFLADIT